MKTLKAQLLALAVIATQKVEIDGLDEPIYVKKLSVGEFNELQKQEKACNERGDLPFMLHFAYFACDKKGTAIFGADELDDIAKLPTELVNSVNKAGYLFNRLDNAASDDPVEAHEKNS